MQTDCWGRASLCNRGMTQQVVFYEQPINRLHVNATGSNRFLALMCLHVIPVLHTISLGALVSPASFKTIMHSFYNNNSKWLGIISETQRAETAWIWVPHKLTFSFFTVKLNEICYKNRSLSSWCCM